MAGRKKGLPQNSKFPQYIDDICRISELHITEICHFAAAHLPAKMPHRELLPHSIFPILGKYRNSTLATIFLRFTYVFCQRLASEEKFRLSPIIK